ncbi:MAG: GlsB/YeaQ/YmgE family stress response membrane protein [Prevotella sp.]|nr:GlsB/YeaQ/YmgE family stress response membrane protein [Prevotella sp.]
MIGAIIVGILAGFIANRLMRGEGAGCVWNLILGLFGGALGGWLFPKLGINVEPTFIGETITGVVGAVIILWIASLLKGKK